MMSKEFKPHYLNDIKEEEFTPKEVPGLNAPKIDSKISIKGGGSGVQVKFFVRSSSVGTGLQQFTGFDFQPSSYSILAWRTSNSTAPTQSDGGYDGTTAICSQIADNQSNTVPGSVLRIFYTNQGGGKTKADHNAFLADGIELDFIDSGESINMRITAYK